MQSGVRLERTLWILIVPLGLAVYLYLNLFAFPRTPFLLNGDQAFFWMDAQRMLNGEQVYQDFFQFTPPGTDLIYLGLFRVFGLYVWVTNLMVLALGLALCWVCFSLASEILERRLAALATFLFLVLIYGKLLNGTHHLFSALIVMWATKLGMRHSTPGWLSCVGALLGLASFFTQTRGVMAMLAFATFLAWGWWREKKAWQVLLRQYLGLGFAFVGTLLVLNAHFIFAVGVKNLWYFQITYVRSHMVHGLGTWSLGLPFTWRQMPRLATFLVVYVLVPVTYLIVLMRCWRDRAQAGLQLQKVALLSLVGTFLLLEVASSLNWLRLYAVSMPAMILLIWAIGQRENLRKNSVALAWVVIVGLAIHQTWSRQSAEQVIVRVPGGRIAVSPQKSEELQWIARRTKPGQFLFEAGGPQLYLPLHLLNPAFLDEVHTNNESPPEYVYLAIQQLEAKKVPFVLWVPRLDVAEDRAAAVAIAELRRYLRERYYLAQAFSNADEIWERKEVSVEHSKEN